MGTTIPTRHRRATLTAAAATFLAVFALAPTSPAAAANTPTLRDCSLLVGIDPDYVQISGVTVTNGSLSVSIANPVVQILASESSDRGDNRNHVTFRAASSSPGAPTTSASGAAIGRVVLSLRLANPMVGHTFKVSWAATFDNGFHACPAFYTLANRSQATAPFLVKITA